MLAHYNVGNMSEDCLFINVYTPNVTRNSRSPVLVIIHGGGFTNGKGNAYGANGIASNIASVCYGMKKIRQETA